MAPDRAQSTHHPREGVAAGDLKEAITLQPIDRDVDALDPRFDERRRVPLQPVSVGGQREVGQPRDPRQPADQTRKVATNQGLSPGQSDRVDTQRDEDADQPLHLLEAEDLGRFHPPQPLGRHAVLAAEVAAVRDRDTQVLYSPTVPVLERHAQPVGPKRSVRIRSAGHPASNSRSDAVSTNPLEPQTKAVAEPMPACSSSAPSMRPV